METIAIDSKLPKRELYRQLAAQIRSLTAGERDFIANLANASALLFYTLQDVNWAGFYLYRGGELVVGGEQDVKEACLFKLLRASLGPHNHRVEPGGRGKVRDGPDRGVVISGDQDIQGLPRYGAVGQWENVWARGLRKTTLTLVPESIAHRLMQIVFDYDATLECGDLSPLW